jgi:lycopene beta-cyclase
VASLTADRVVLTDGSAYSAPCVIDARGFSDDADLIAGYQKFLGLDLRLEAPHGEADPILMDGRVTQRGGLRFMYTLPWSANRIQLGEARYSDSPEVPREEFRKGILAYAERRGWRIAEIEREEVGVLPAPLEGDWESLYGRATVPTAGVRAGLFHATTGYSLPYAVRFAEALAELERPDSPSVARLTREMSRRQWKRSGYFRLLNRMLFRAAEPEERIPMFQQFYRRPEGLIQRFYQGELRFTDHLRIMTGRPPISLFRAMNVFLGRA